jgi:hypothetical protein
MKHVMLVVAVLALAGVPALGNWADDFQSYAPGSNISGQGGWEGWNLSATAATISTAHPKFAGDQAVLMATNDDLVHQYSGYTSGQYLYRAMQYIPSNHTGTVTYFIMMNKYSVTPDSKGWSVQMKFDYTAGVVNDDESTTKANVPIVYDAWKEIKVLIDLDANTQTTYYNGTLVGTADWYNPADANHLKSVAAVDLWADNGGGGVCYDDISLVPEPVSLSLLALGGLLLGRRRHA